MLYGHHDEGQRCACVTTHRPEPLELNSHHVHPLEYGGPDIPGNRVWLCPTTHVNVHELLRAILAARGTLTWAQVRAQQVRPVSRYAWTVAWDGYRRMQAAGKVPR